MVLTGVFVVPVCVCYHVRVVLCQLYTSAKCALCRWIVNLHWAAMFWSMSTMAIYITLLIHFHLSSWFSDTGQNMLLRPLVEVPFRPLYTKLQQCTFHLSDRVIILLSVWRSAMHAYLFLCKQILMGVFCNDWSFCTSCPTNIFLCCRVGLPVASGHIVVVGVATYLHPAVRWWTAGHYEDSQSGGDQLPLSSQ